MAYSGEQVDDAISKFEKCAERCRANKSSAVRLNAAEKDLLKAAEVCRDLLWKAVQGDKGLLSNVFGGDCRRFHRVRQVLDDFEMSEANAADNRWQDLRKNVDIIEEVLKQLGIFKPWVKDPAPKSVSFTAFPRFLTPGSVFAFQAVVEGCECTAVTYTVEPALPAFLALNPKTGALAGRPRPGVEVDEQTYIVTASNAAGSVTTELTFAVKAPPPESISYPAHACMVGDRICWAAEVVGGQPQSYSVTPALPRGLELDPLTGTISGTPARHMDSTTYTVVGENTSGRAEGTFEVSVHLAPPTSVAYPDLAGDMPFGGNIYLVPEVLLKQAGGKTARVTVTAASGRGGLAAAAKWGRNFATNGLYVGTKWGRARAAHWENIMLKGLMPELSFSVSPELPPGLILAKSTGVICGRPTEVTPKRSYQVTVKNETGEAHVKIHFAVVLSPPTALAYPDLVEAQVFVGQPITAFPEVEGLIKEWAVEPDLPPGLALDQAMGSIGGIPLEPLPECTWKVTASNDAGSTSATVSFAVQKPAPSNFAYQSLVHEYPLDREMELLPRFDGQVDHFSVRPDLPPGLSLDEKSGRIAGTPTELSETTVYVVTAENETGACKATIAFAVKVMPPVALAYPRVDDLYHVGESVDMKPHVQGGATSWTIEPALPEGLTIEPATGRIAGTFAALADEASYTVTASNDAGGTSVVLTFAVIAPAPEGLAYPEAGSNYIVGQPLHIEPVVKSGASGLTFSVTPAMPPGLEMHPATGVIHGIPTEPTDLKGYEIVARNPAGAAETTLFFRCCQAPEPQPVLGQSQEADGVDQAFAASIEEITDIAEMPLAPERGRKACDWMIWMVHRAWLNDPTLDVFEFTRIRMPLPHVEPRIAPKLMKAMVHNTHIRSLLLADSNLRSPQCSQLAEALRKNQVLEVLNIETNYIDPDGVKYLAEALKENKTVHTWRFSNQRDRGKDFGRPVEQAMAEMMQTNKTITKLGFQCADPHWNNVINNCLINNADIARRKRKGGELVDKPAERVAEAQKRTLSKIIFETPPEKALWELFEDALEGGDEKQRVMRAFTAEKKRLPTKEQVQSYARSKGVTMPYNQLAPLLKEFRSKMLNCIIGSQLSLVDSFSKRAKGVLHAWTEKNERFNLEVVTEDGVRCDYRAEKEPVVEVGAEFAAWLSPSP